MEQDDFEGTAVLEMLAEAGQIDAFFSAIHDEDFQAASLVLQGVGVDAATIRLVIRKMSDADSKH